MAITNYVVQCEVVFYFVRSVRELVKQKQHPSMDAAVKASMLMLCVFQYSLSFYSLPHLFLKYL